MTERFERFFVWTNKMLIGVMMGLMFILVFTNVVARYCFGFSFMTAEEISTFLMIWITYLGAGLALREGRHAAIDLFQDFLPRKIRLVLRAFLGILILSFFLVLAYYGIKLSQFAWGQETMATQISKGIPYLGVPIGAMGIGLHLILMFRDWVDKRWEEMPVEEETDMIESEVL